MLDNKYIGILMSDANMRLVLAGEKATHVFRSASYWPRVFPGARFYLKESLRWKDPVGIIYKNGDEEIIDVPDDHGLSGIRSCIGPAFMPKWARRFDMIIDTVELTEIDGRECVLAAVTIERTVKEQQ